MLFAIGFSFINVALLFSGIDAAFTVSSAAVTPPFRSSVVVTRRIASRTGSPNPVTVPARAATLRQPHRLFRRNGSGEHTWCKHVVKQGITLALPAIVMLSVVTATPIVIINPQPVQAAAAEAVATKEGITMLKNMFDELDNKIDAQSNKIDSLVNKMDTQKTETKNIFDALSNKIGPIGSIVLSAGIAIVSAVLSAGIAAWINSRAILELKKDTKELAKDVAKEAVKELATRMATLGSAKDIHK